MKDYKSVLIVILLILVSIANCFCQESVDKVLDARNFQSQAYYIDYSFNADLDHYNIGVYSAEEGFVDCENFHGKELSFDADRNIYFIQKGSFTFYFDHNLKLGQIKVILDHYTATDLFVKIPW